MPAVFCSETPDRVGQGSFYCLEANGHQSDEDRQQAGKHETSTN